MSRPAQRLLLVLGALAGIVVLLAAVEGVLALAGVEPIDPPPPIGWRHPAEADVGEPVWDRELLFRLPPSSEFLGYYRTNRLGYRDVEFSVEKPPGTYRIVCIGDSCTFGLGVEVQDTWPRQLARMLDLAFEDAMRFEVLNFGVTGYSSFQNRRQVETELMAFDPDLVVQLPTSRNDATPHPTPDEERARHNRSLQFELSRLRLARVLGVAVRMSLPRDWDVPPDPGSKTRVPVERQADHLVATLQECRAHDVRFLLVAYAMAPAAYERTASLAVRERLVLATAQEQGVPIADPRAGLIALQPYIDSIHPDAAGQRLVAGAVFRALIEEAGLLPAGERLAALRWWLAAGREGLAAVGAELPVSESALPPRLRDLLRAYATGPDADPVADDVLVKKTSGLDPLLSQPPPAYGAGRLHLRALQGDASGEARRRADEIDREVFPADPLRRFLWGAAPPTPPSAEQLRVARAFAVFEGLLELEPEPADLRVVRAMQLQQAGDTATALVLLDEVLALDPTCNDALFARIGAGRRSGRHVQVVSDLDRLAALEPDSARVAALRGLQAFGLERYDEAIEHLSRATELHPIGAESHYLLGRARLLRDDIDGAEASLRSAWSLNRTAFTDIPELLEEIERRRGP